MKSEYINMHAYVNLSVGLPDLPDGGDHIIEAETMQGIFIMINYN